MSEHAFKCREREEAADCPPEGSREPRSLRFPWRRYQISLFWKFGIKITRPKRTKMALPVPARSKELPGEIQNREPERPATGIAAYAVEGRAS